MISFICRIKKKEEERKKIHRYREQIGGCQRQRWGAVGEMGEHGQRVQTPSYKINKSWGCNVPHYGYCQK